MARKKKEKLDPSADLDMTPMIDCVFLLLIFFMVTTVFKNPQQLKLTLPNAAHPQQLEKNTIIAEINEAGELAIDSQLVSMDTVDTYIMNAKQKKGVNTMLIKADQATKHGDVIKLMMLARSVEIESIAMATETPKEE
jgi:biopolymer transport protein ExbD